MTHQGSYIELLRDGTLEKRITELNKHMEECTLCPHECKVDRREKTGFCQAGNKALVSSYNPHYGEESVLVGKRGSGTIFFGYCNMRCVFCQNHTLSFSGEGRSVTNTELANMMLSLQDKYKCHNINLVSPTHFTPNIAEAIYLGAQRGLVIPIVYNCGGYESIKILKLLEGIVDIYMPDFKYFRNETGRKYSQVQGYSDMAKLALKEMDRQVGGMKTHKGIGYRGLLIRHLVLPGNVDETRDILSFIKSDLSKDVLVNLMGQYYPANLAHKFPPLNRRISHSEYGEALKYAKELGLRLA